MRKAFLRIISSSLAVMILLSLFAGCSQKEEPAPAADAAPASSQAQPAAAAEEKAESGKITDKPITLTYWYDMPADKVAPIFKNMSEMEMYKELEKRTGIKIEFQHPPAGQANDQFNLMIASRDLPDIIERNFGNAGVGGYPGGAEKAIQDGVIVKLNDLLEKNAPNLTKFYAENKEAEKQSKTDNGSFYNFPFVRGDEAIKVFYGPQIRKDWLDELGLQVPETIDEWYQVLTAIKDKKKIDYPLSFKQNSSKGNNDIGIGNSFIGAFGVAYEWYVEDGKVKYGAVESGYKDFLATFSKWYAEKLIDPDFPVQDDKTWRAKIAGGKAAAFMSYAGGGMGYFYDLLLKDNPGFKLAGVPYPSLKKGEKAKFGQRDFTVPYACVSITTANKYPVESTKWLDYGYGPEGHMLYNFGIEGVSYKMENGYPKYTDIVTKNPEGKSMSLAMSNFMRSHYNGPFIQDKRYFEQFMKYPDQVAAVGEWSKAGYESNWPALTPTPEESEKIASIMTEVKVYQDEMFTKFIMGQEPIDKFDQYVDRLNQMGLKDAIVIYQTAFERYLKR